MTFPEFITYCELKQLFAVRINGIDGTTCAIKTPDDNIGLHLKFKIIDCIPVIIKGHYYKFIDHEINFNDSYNITMPEIEKVFFPDDIS